MNPIAFAIAVPAAFAAGVVFHKYVISEAEAVKLHVTSSLMSTEAIIRAEIEKAIDSVKTGAGKL